MLDQDYPITAARRGTIEFVPPSNGQISVLGLRINGSSITAIPVFSNTGVSGSSIPIHINFNGFETEFTLFNAGTTAAAATLNFFDDHGNPLTVPLSMPQSASTNISSTLTSTVEPGASLLIRTEGEEMLPTMVGSAQLITTGDVRGFAVLRWIRFGREASVPLETRNANAYLVAFDNTDGRTTGLAVANVTNQPGDVIVNVRDDLGTLLQSDAVGLPANGHSSFMLPDRYVTSVGKRGTVEFITPGGGRISVMDLRAKEDGTLSALPALTK